MLKQKIQDELNKQINAEMFSAYLYLSMSAYFTSKSLDGFANWMKVQAQEEMTHAMKIYDYINERSGKVHLTTIEGPKNTWESPENAFDETYKHEQKVTKMINDLVNLSISEADHATSNFLQWFVSEQVEEEANASGLLEQLRLVGNSGNAILMLDRELATRVFTPLTTKGE